MESEINMNMFRLEKAVKLNKPQFDYFNLNRTGEYELDRVSLELDSILFRIKYMIKKGYTGYMELENVFTEKAIHLRKLFGEFMYDFLVHIVTIPSECHIDDIYDVLAKDVKINTTHVSFIMTLVSPNKKYLEFVDKSIPDGIMNMFPYKYFRFQTDSYNDAISKAFPELFANKRQNVIGVGDDEDVFVHNLTFQTTERCSLNCTYCFTGETEVLMADGSHKRIDDIKVGDVVAGFKEKFPPNDLRANLPAEVTQVFHHRSDDVMKLSHSYIMDTYITANHKVATTNGGCRREWLAVNELQPDRNPLLRVRTTQTSATPCFAYNITAVNGTHDVYNIETTTHTYVANNLAVHNCYQFNKSPMRMEFNTAKKFIDHLLNDDYGYINRYNSPAIIIEFIGGEPLLEIKLTRQIYEYFLDRCYELNHPWFTMHRVSICSNGLQYFDEDVQEFFKEYASNISFNISIDGNKQLHDSCRIQPNGEGSYDIAMASLNHFNRHYTSERNSKMTLAPSNIKYLFESVVDFINNGMKCINLNCVFEEGWTPETAKVEYYQLKQLADYLIKNNLESIFIALFTDRQEGIQDKYNDGSFCFKEGTHVLTPDGGKSIETLLPGDSIFTASGNIHRVCKMNQYTSDNNLIIRASGTFRIRCTSDHMVFAKKFLYMGWKGVIHYSAPGFYPVSELKVGDRLGLPILDLEKNVSKPMSIEMAYAVGLYIADGYTSNKHGEICITPGYDEDKKWLNVLIDAGITVREFDGATSRQYYINKSVSDINAKFCKICWSCGHRAINKHFPSVLFISHIDIIRACINGYLDKDGYVVNRTESNFYGLHKVNSVSFNLMNDLLILLRSLGEYPTCYHYKREGYMCIEGRRVHVHDRYEVYYNPLKRNIANKFKLDDTYNVMWTGIHEICKDESYQVFCPTVVPMDNDDQVEHTFIANGVAVVNCGGSGSMTAIRPNGQIYPCIRYMPTSVGDDVPDLCMGSVDDGWVERSDGSEVIKILDSVTRRGSSNDICFNCPLSNNCPNCTALGLAVYGTPNHRTTFHCIQHIAEALANVYYWNSLILVHPEWDIPVRHNVVPDQWAKIIIDDNELEMLKDIEQKAINAKNYNRRI